MMEQFSVFQGKMDDLSRLSEGAVTDEAAEMMYSIALSFWQSKQYDKASDAYSFLLVFRPQNPKYLDAMARCAYDMGQYQRAMSLYAYSGICGGDLGRSILCTAKCYLLLGDRKKASFLFDYITQAFQDDSSFCSSDVAEEAAAILEVIGDRGKSSTKEKD